MCWGTRLGQLSIFVQRRSSSCVVRERCRTKDEPRVVCSDEARRQINYVLGNCTTIVDLGCISFGMVKCVECIHYSSEYKSSTPTLTPPTTNTLVTDYIDHSCYLTTLEITEIVERSVVGRRV